MSVAALMSLAFAGFAQQAPAAVGVTSPMGKVGVISVQGAIVGTRDGQKASQELDAKFSPKKKEFDSRQSEITQLQDQYNKGGTVMAEDKRQQLARDIDEKRSAWSVTCKTRRKSCRANSSGSCRVWASA